MGYTLLVAHGEDISESLGTVGTCYRPMGLKNSKDNMLLGFLVR